MRQLAVNMPVGPQVGQARRSMAPDGLVALGSAASIMAS